MAKNDLLGLDDDDLLLLDPDSGEFLNGGESDTAKNDAAASAKTAAPLFDDDDDDDDLDEEEVKPKKAKKEKKEKKKKKRAKSSYKGAVIFLIILLILILAAAAVLYRLHMVGGDWNRFLPFQIGTQQELTVETPAEETEAEEQPAEEVTEEAAPEEEPAEEAPAEEEPAAEEPAEEAPAEEEPAEETAAEEEPAEEVDPNSFEGMAVTKLLPDGEVDTDSLVQVNNVGVEQADGSHILNKDAASAAHDLIAAAKTDGYTLMLSTCYRDQDSFDEDRTVDDLEHATGIVLDIVSVDHQVPLDFADKCPDEIKWLEEHAADYGFVLRYPADKTEETGHDYMAYHFVYVGKEIAAEMKENSWCLEEYLNRSTEAADASAETTDASAETTETAADGTDTATDTTAADGTEDTAAAPVA